MYRYDYPAYIQDSDGLHVIRLRDFPEAKATPAEGETDEQWAEYLVLNMVWFAMKEGRLVPEASKPLPGDIVIHLPKNAVLKVLLHNLMIKNGIDKKELARRMDCTPARAARIMTLRQYINLEDMDKAISAAGGKLVVTLEDALK